MAEIKCFFRVGGSYKEQFLARVTERGSVSKKLYFVAAGIADCYYRYDLFSDLEWFVNLSGLCARQDGEEVFELLEDSYDSGMVYFIHTAVGGPGRDEWYDFDVMFTDEDERDQVAQVMEKWMRENTGKKKCKTKDRPEA